MQIVTHGYGSAEVLVTLADLPTNSNSYISNVINLAPCAIATFLNKESSMRSSGSEHRLLAGVIDEEFEDEDQVLEEKALQYDSLL